MVRRGDIYYADLSPVVGSEQGGMRPVLIVQNDTGNKVLDTVLTLCPAATFTLENQDCGPSLDWLRQHGYGANT